MKDTQDSYTKVTYLDSSVARLEMYDEEGKNSLSEAFSSSLTRSIAQLTNDNTLKVVILSGLPTVFCAGADLDTLQNLGKGKLQPADILLSKLLLDIPIPVIAAIEGHAIGGGLALALCADIVLLAEESRYGCSFMNMGFTPGMGITKLMENFMSTAMAQEMLYTGMFKRGKDLKGKTNINYILPKKEVLPMAEQIAESIAEKPARALRVLKRYLGMEKRKLFEETRSVESMMHELTFNQEDILQQIQENYVR